MKKRKDPIGGFGLFSCECINRINEAFDRIEEQEAGGVETEEEIIKHRGTE